MGAADTPAPGAHAAAASPPGARAGPPSPPPAHRAPRPRAAAPRPMAPAALARLLQAAGLAAMAYVGRLVVAAREGARMAQLEPGGLAPPLAAALAALLLL